MGPLGMGVRIRMIMDHESNDACTGRMKRVWAAEACVDGMHPFVRGPHLSEIFSCRYCFDRIGQGIWGIPELNSPKKCVYLVDRHS